MGECRLQGSYDGLGLVQPAQEERGDAYRGQAKRGPRSFIIGDEGETPGGQVDRPGELAADPPDGGRTAVDRSLGQPVGCQK